MIDTMKSWWASRSLRERNLLGIMFALLIPLLLWYAVATPFWSALVGAKVRHDTAVEALGRVNAKAAILKKLEQAPPQPLAAPLQSVIAQSAAEAGFSLTRSEPTVDDGLLISLAAAKSAAFFAWVSKLETQGLFVQQASIRANPDATIAVDMTIKAQKR
jgi:general secretion pathway protein M